MGTVVLRMFRTCGERRDPPLGTLTVLLEDDGTQKALYIPDDASRRDLYPILGLEVVDPPARTEADPYPAGTVVARTAAHGELRWRFFKELPVSASVIHQSIAKVSMIPRVK